MSPDSENQLKKKLKQLKSEKGIASKAVGEAKKKGQDASKLIEQVKTLSAEIKLLEGDLKSLKQARSNTNTSEQKSTDHHYLPPQFQKRKLGASPEQSLTIIDDLSDTQWDEYVTGHPNATLYHSSAIRRVITQTFGHKSHYLAAINSHNEVAGILPLIEMQSRLFGHFLVSVPFFNYGGLLASTAQSEQQLLIAAKELAQQCDVEHIEYRHTHDELDLPSRSEKVAMLLTLPESPDQLWSAIGTKVRAQIKKAQRHELQCRHGREELIDDFYAVFSRNMRDLGTPVYSKTLFENMLKQLPEAWISIIYRKQKPVSCGFLVSWRDTVEIPWASTLKQANQWDANMLLYWEILKQTIENNYKIFDFGRSSKEAPTYRFKKQWGARPQDLYWHYWLPDQQALPQINPNNPKFKLMVETWKRLPLPISNRIGPNIVKSIP